MVRKENIVAAIISVLIISSIIVYAIAQQLFITTDKPTYTAGDTIVVSGYGPANAILIMMVYLTNKTLYLDQLSLGSNGNFTITLPTFSIESIGTHTVWIAGKAYSEGELVAETTTSFLYVVPGAETNTTTVTNTTIPTVTETVTETATITETQTETVTETLVSTTTVTTTQTVTETVTQTETTTETTTQMVTETQTVTTTQTQTQTVTQTTTETTTITQTETTTETTTMLQPTTITQTITAPAPLAEKIVYLVVGLFVGIAITYAMRVLTTKQQ